MKKKIGIILIIGILMISMVGLSGCHDIRGHSIHEFFNGEVVIEYTQYNRQMDDFLKITFNSDGIYNLTFNPALEIGKNKTFVINTCPPQTRIISQYQLPDYLTITILHDGNFESYEFK